MQTAASVGPEIFVANLQSIFVSQIKDPELITLLFHEAKENIIDGRYPLKEARDYDKLAGMQAMIEHKTWQPDRFTEEYFKYVIIMYHR